MKRVKNKPDTPGTRLQGLLDEYGISPERLAVIVRMSGPAIRSIVNNEATPYRSTIEKLATTLGTTVEYLQRGEGEPLPNGKRNLTPAAPGSEPWKDEAWHLAKEQIHEKDSLLRTLAVSLDRVTKMMQDSGINFLHPVRETGS